VHLVDPPAFNVIEVSARRFPVGWSMSELKVYRTGYRSALILMIKAEQYLSRFVERGGVFQEAVERMENPRISFFFGKNG
jgi:hypothetical protein